VKKVITASRVVMGNKFALYWDCPNKKCPEISMITQEVLNVLQDYKCPKCSILYKGTVLLSEGRHAVKFTIEVIST
jgi:hypothetical protein